MRRIIPVIAAAIIGTISVAGAAVYATSSQQPKFVYGQLGVLPDMTRIKTAEDINGVVMVVENGWCATDRMRIRASGLLEKTIGARDIIFAELHIGRDDHRYASANDPSLCQDHQLVAVPRKLWFSAVRDYKR